MTTASASREGQIGRFEGVMIGKRVAGERYSELAQVVEEALRIADSGDRVHALPGKVLGVPLAAPD